MLGIMEVLAVRSPEERVHEAQGLGGFPARTDQVALCRGGGSGLRELSPDGLVNSVQSFAGVKACVEQLLDRIGLLLLVEDRHAWIPICPLFGDLTPELIILRRG